MISYCLVPISSQKGVLFSETPGILAAKSKQLRKTEKSPAKLDRKRRHRQQQRNRQREQAQEAGLGPNSI